MSDIYTLDPSTIKFDDKYVMFNPIQNELEYEATKQNIKQLGQLEPILMLDNRCVDGRHRTKIAKELGITVKCINLPVDMKEEDIIVRCNTNVMSGRDYDNAQKAIQALTLVNEYDMSVGAAAKIMKVDRRLVSYASTIKGFGRDDLLEGLMEGKKVQLKNMVRPSKSLEVICKHVKADTEEPKILVDDSERVHFKPDSVLKSEQGKAWYYQTVENLKTSVDPDVAIGMLLVELANLKFKLGTE